MWFNNDFWNGQSELQSFVITQKQPHIVTIWFSIYFMLGLWWNRMNYNSTNNTSHLYIWTPSHFQDIWIFALKHASTLVSGPSFMPSDRCGWIQCSQRSVSAKCKEHCITTCYSTTLYTHKYEKSQLHKCEFSTFLPWSCFHPWPHEQMWFVYHPTSAPVQVCLLLGLQHSRK